VDERDGLDVNSIVFENYKQACDVLSKEVAAGILESKAAPVDTQTEATTTGSVTVTSCSYGDDAAGRDQNIASILLRAAADKDSAQANIDGFFETKGLASNGDQRVAVEDIVDLGSKAYWNPGLGQVNVLVESGKYWLIASITRGANDYNQGLAIAFAAEIVKELEK
jgi:hypothetical protein